MRLPSLAIMAVCLVGPLTGCNAPPPDAYVTSSTVAVTTAGDPVGVDTQGEQCVALPGQIPVTDLPAIGGRDVFCGGWTQPGARVIALRGATDAAQLDAIAGGGLWRSWLDHRFACGQPQATTLSNGAPARLLGCTRRTGGWPHLAIVAAGTDGPVLADGLVTTRAVVERMIAGQAPVDTAGGRARPAALELAVARLTSGAFAAADIGRYEQLMALGGQLNQTENYAAAEDAYRAALAMQERLLGRDNPNTVQAEMNLALNLSNQGRRAQAAPLFARAETLAPRAADPLAPARLLHYRGLDALNAGEPARAAELLERAERGYAAFAPPRGRPAADDDVASDVVTDPLAQSATLGLAEARRNRGLAIARGGNPDAGERLVRDARAILREARLEPNIVVGRSLRTVAGSTGTLGRDQEQAQLLSDSARAFRLGAPGERPEAATLFLAGSRALQAGRRSSALEAFRAGAQVLRSRQIALSIPLVMPYLDALWAEGAANGAASVSAEMFQASQLAQRGQTAQIVAQAAARLGASGGNVPVANAVRRLQDSDRDLRTLYAQRDAADGPDAHEFDARITAAQTARSEAESEVAAAAPGYRQLLQSVADVPAVAAVLAPHDALVTMLFGRDHGYALSLRADGSVRAARIDIKEADLTALVTRVRATMGPGADGRLGAFDSAASHAIYEAVLAPLAPAMADVDTLLVSPDGPLLSIPFGLLLAAPARADQLRDAAWLVRTYAIVHVPSPQTLVTLRAGAGASSGTLPYLGFGDPVPPTASQLARTFPSDRCGTDSRLAAQLGALPGTRTELEASRKLTGAAPNSIYLGTAFTQASLLGSGISQGRIIHLATHALLPGELSCLREPTVLVSAPRGAADASASFVPASTLINLKLDADLVILSACNTGTSESGSGSGGEALSGLARAFFFAGARGLMVTHWSVNDIASALTIARTLAEQQAGKSSAAALRDAQLAMLRSADQQPEFAHPFFWAPFALIGDGRRTTMERKTVEVSKGASM